MSMSFMNKLPNIHVNSVIFGHGTRNVPSLMSMLNTRITRLYHVITAMKKGLFPEENEINMLQADIQMRWKRFLFNVSMLVILSGK